MIHDLLDRKTQAVFAVKDGDLLVFARDIARTSTPMACLLQCCTSIQKTGCNSFQILLCLLRRKQKYCQLKPCLHADRSRIVCLMDAGNDSPGLLQLENVRRASGQKIQPFSVDFLLQQRCLRRAICGSPSSFLKNLSQARRC